MDNFKVISRSKKNGSTKSLLNQGLVPGIIYGKDTDPTQIAFENKVIQKLMHSGGFYSKIINLDINGKKEQVLPKQLQYHPVTDKLIHFDFLRVQENTKVTVEVEVEFLNRDICPGLKKGGVLNLVRRLVELNCNANKIPEKLEFDLTNSEIGDAVKISNINLPEGVKPTISDRDFVVATLAPPTVEVEAKTEEADADKADDDKADADKADVKDNPDDKKEGSSEEKSKEK
jgi:large subunit ribosomal protein L25